MTNEDTTARWAGERTQDAEDAAAERRDHEAEQRREMEARLARLQQRVAAEEERQSGADEADSQPQHGWHVRTHPDIALWHDGRRIVGTREPIPAVVMRALRGAQQQGQLDALMRAALPPADEPRRVDELATDVNGLRAELVREQSRAADADRRAAAYADQLDSARAEAESWKARALRPPWRRQEAEPQQVQDCPDCKDIRREAQRLRQINTALQERANAAGGLRRQRDQALAELQRLREAPELRLDVELPPSITQASADQLRKALRETPYAPNWSTPSEADPGDTAEPRWRRLWQRLTRR